MSGSDRSAARFRSATEFPKTVEHLSASESDQLYVEMRECLIFTNRSRSQLLRRNEEHKQTTLSLKADVVRLQGLIHQLNSEKQELVQGRQGAIVELEHELKTMTAHLDQLSKAFEEVEDVNGAMGVLAIPGRFTKFWQALKALILWWREEYGEEAAPPAKVLPSSPQQVNEDDRRENPQMYTDPASVQRSLRDQ
jgi:hypothetical protein